MSRENEHESPSQRALDALIDEAKEASAEGASGANVANVANVNWDRVDAALFARVEREAAHTRALASHRGRPGAWLLLGGVAAAAAAAAVVLHPSVRASMEGGAPVSTLSSTGSAGDLALQKGAGEILVAGEKARTGARARAGDTVGTRGAKAVFEVPGRVSWLLEDESSVTVERAGAPGTPVVLALREGALEAQVAPVASGEAFSVDVDGVRVAVHGTHLRVARAGDRVVVDLTEGVVSIGAPPKSGSTYGTLVTAPAHVEFRAGALAESLTVDHTTTAVRTAADLDSVIDGETTASITPPPPPAPRTDDNATPPPKRGAPATSQPRTTKVARNPNAERDLANAARACAAAEPPSTSVKATYNGAAIFQVGHDGRVIGFGNFSPPIGIESIHKCVAAALHDSRFVEPGDHRVPLEFQH